MDEAHQIDNTHINILRNGRWQRMFRPINPDRPFSGVSLAESFAEKYASENGVDVGLICCADGGTSLDQWKRGGVLFDNAVYQTELAKRTSVVCGILWHQGEADCGVELCSTYKERFETFVNDLREAADLENVPLLIGGMGDFLVKCPLDDNLKNSPEMNKVLEQIASDDELISFVPATGLGSNEDLLHFSADALYDFGLRYYEKYAEFGFEAGNVSLSDNDDKRTEMEAL